MMKKELDAKLQMVSERISKWNNQFSTEQKLKIEGSNEKEKLYLQEENFEEHKEEEIEEEIQGILI